MNRLVAILLSCALLLQCLARFSVLGVYELRKDFVATRLCENRDRPELNCCGKCVLQKQLTKADDAAGDSKHTPKKPEGHEYAARIHSLETRAPSVFHGVRLKAYNPRRQHMRNGGIPRQVFRPPAA